MQLGTDTSPAAEGRENLELWATVSMLRGPGAASSPKKGPGLAQAFLEKRYFC